MTNDHRTLTEPMTGSVILSARDRLSDKVAMPVPARSRFQNRAPYRCKSQVEWGGVSRTIVYARGAGAEARAARPSTNGTAPAGARVAEEAGLGWFTAVVPISTRASSYLICGTPRTGSTLLCGLLRSTGVAGRPESYFQAADEQSWVSRWRLPRGPRGSFDYRDFVRAAVAEGSASNGVFGARVMWGTMDEIIVKLGALHPALAGTDLDLLSQAFGPTRFVHLWRDDTVAQAVSWARAEQTNYWQHGDTVPPGREPHYDFDAIHSFIETINQHNAAWRDWFAAWDVRPHPMRYEELVADMAGATLEVLNYLGLRLPSSRIITHRDRRQSDSINDQWIARYHAGERSR